MEDKRISLLIDIQNNIKAQESAGFAQWAKINNLKQAAKTLNFLTEHGIDNYDELAQKAASLNENTASILSAIKQTEQRTTDLIYLIVVTSV